MRSLGARVRGSTAGRRAVTALLLPLVWGATLGSFYEWGGAAARGVKELREKRNREAASSLRSARKELPQSAAVRYDEALALERAGQADSARRIYEETLQSPELRGDAARSAAAYNLGNDALQNGKLKEAMEHYRESLRIDPSRIDAKRNLEEAIRRGRVAPPPQSGGAAGGTGHAPPAPGTGARPPAGGAGAQPPSGSRDGTGGGDRNPESVTGDIPDRAEAEHWLEALEAERKAARLRDRRVQQGEPNAKDW